MRRRSPARFLAPLALIIAVLAVYLIVKPSPGSGSASSGTTSASTTSTTAKRSKKPSSSSSKGSRKRGKTYTVQSGDTLSAIAAQTGIPVQSLLQFNPGVDANSMRVGQKLKLAG